jgi:uncharacterized surface protein with fasciclin (FAS1) repeats
MQNTPGLVRGTCEDAGYTVSIGDTSMGRCPGFTCVHIQLYAPTGSEICSAEQMQPIITACAPYDSMQDAGICGSPCEAAARQLMAPGSCFAQGDVHGVLDTVTATCSGYVAADGAATCNKGLYFEAYNDVPEGSNFRFNGGAANGGWAHTGSLQDRSGHLADIDAWVPTVEHPEHTHDLSYESADQFVSDIDGFSDASQFVMRWRGTFTAPSAGDYTFSTTSDDGSVLYINGAKVVDNDGLHSARERHGAVTLAAGAHSIMVVFFENGGGASITARVTMPGSQAPVVLGGDMVSNSIGCGDDAGVSVGENDRCAVGFCEDSSDCPQCAAGLSCEVAEDMACAGTCYGHCVSVASADCSTCAQLGWETGGDSVCSESDEINQGDADWKCVNTITQADAEEHCMSAGARLCTAAELFEAGEGTGTGCGHDSRLIWSSSQALLSGHYDLRCREFEQVVVPGNVPAMGQNGLAPMCMNVGNDAAALRCCADTTCAGAAAAPAVPNIVELGQSLPDFSTLVAAVVAGGLAGTLSGPGPFTVFAPTNAAFAALGEAAVATLLADHDALVDLLTYHVVSGEVLSKDLAGGQRLQTVEGGRLKIRLTSSGVYVVASGSQALVTQADVQASNGVVHAIDTVLLPSAAAKPACATCKTLGWDAGDNDVCAESDNGFECQSELDFADARRACTDFGARLCTPAELLSGEGQGTGCGHDSRYIWSTGGVNPESRERCRSGELLAVLGNTARASRTRPATQCVATVTGSASLRCCADTRCSKAPGGGH